MSAFKCEDCNLCDTLDSNNYGSDCETNCGFCPLCYIFNIDANAVEGCKWCKRGTDDKYGQNTCLKLCLKGEENCSATGPCQTQCGFWFGSIKFQRKLAFGKKDLIESGT